MDPLLSPLGEVLERVDARLLSPEGDGRIWPTGFPLLDDALGGGLRAGGLHLLAGAQGEGKTTFALQVARGAARSGRPILFFSFELEPEVLLQKVIAAEAAELGAAHGAGHGVTVYQVRAAFEDTDDGEGGLPERLRGYPGGLDALEAVAAYAQRMLIHRSTTSQTHLDVIATAVKEVIVEFGESPLVVVDYLQKVRPPVARGEEESVTVVTERLKDIAIEFDCPVLAISASDRAGLEPGQRMRARNLKGSTALAYEADVVLVLANKSDIVARHHLMYSGDNGETFKSWSVLSLEKNRSGHAGAELEFRKDFARGRFLADGAVVTEKLVDERVFTQ